MRSVSLAQRGLGRALLARSPGGGGGASLAPRLRRLTEPMAAGCRAASGSSEGSLAAAAAAAAAAEAEGGAAEQALTSMSTGATPVLTEIGDPEAKRAEMIRYFNASYAKDSALYEELLGGSMAESMYIRSEPLRHPLIFYYGHTAVLYVNKLLLAGMIPGHVNESYESMMAIGVDEMSWDDLNDKHYDWPTVEAVREYREEVRQMVEGLMLTMEMPRTINWDSEWWPIVMGIEHQNIHIETSSVIMRRLALAHFTDEARAGSLPNWRKASSTNTGEFAEQKFPANELLPVPSSAVLHNKNTENARVYGWDNEYGEHCAELQTFQASKFLVSNGEFNAFVQDGGYQQRDLWTQEGWSWVSYTGAAHPLWWRMEDEAQPMLRLLSEEVPLPWDWPAEVNQLEAAAFCTWKSAKENDTIRLPTEDEWYVMRDSIPGGPRELDLPDWAPGEAPGNVNLEHYASPCPVDEFQWGETSFFDVIGNVWQWTETPIDGYKGYKTHPLYDDFSAPTFDGKHNVFKGGSWISMGCNGATRESRYSFRRHFFQHAGFRYVRSDNALNNDVSALETKPETALELEAHYGVGLGVGSTAALGTNFYHAAVEHVVAAVGEAGATTGRALDLGCSVGRATFELGKHYDDVLGLHSTIRLPNHALGLQSDDRRRYMLPLEGSISEFQEVTLSSLGLTDAAQRCSFVQQDPCNLEPQKLRSDGGEGFDLIFAMNLLETLTLPGQMLRSLGELVNPGGFVALGSTYDWDESLTSRENWIGGYRDDGTGENVTGALGVAAIMSEQFEQVGAPCDLSLVRPKTKRTFEQSLCHVGVWRKK